MLGREYEKNITYNHSTRIDDVNNEVYVNSTTNEHTRFKSDRELYSEYLGIGRYFVLICLIIFFIAPVFTELNNNWRWNVEEVGNTYVYTNPKDNVEEYKNLGNKMMEGFTVTLETIGNISEYATNVTSVLEKPLGWFSDLYNGVLEGYNNVLEWFNGLF